MSEAKVLSLITEYKQQLDKCKSAETPDLEKMNDLLLGILALDGVQPTMLKMTKIGFTINKLRKASPNDAIKVTATKIVKKWRKLVQHTSSPPSSSPSSSSSSSSSSSLSSSSSSASSSYVSSASSSSLKLKLKLRVKPESPAPSTPHSTSDSRVKYEASSPSASSPSSIKTELKPLTFSAHATSKTRSKSTSTSTSTSASMYSSQACESFFSLGRTTDKLRNKIQKLLYDALGPNTNNINTSNINTGHAKTEAASSKQAEMARAFQLSRTDIAVRIEQCMFDTYKTTDRKYKEKYRSLVYNLRDASNPDVNAQLYDGSLQPEMIVFKSDTELASANLTKLRQDNSQWMKDAARSDWNKGLGETEMFKCGRCKKRRTVYYQKQTRCADEPMTTFVTCLECNNRWRC